MSAGTSHQVGRSATLPGGPCGPGGPAAPAARSRGSGTASRGLSRNSEVGSGTGP